MMAGSKLRSRLPAMEAKRYRPMPDHFPDAGKMVDQQSAQSEAPMTERMIWPPMPEHFDDLLANYAWAWQPRNRETLAQHKAHLISAIAEQRRACALAALEAAIRLCDSEPERQRGDGVFAADQAACVQALEKLKDSL